MNTTTIRSRWAAVGAAVAVSLGAGGIGITHATISSGERAVFVPLDEPCRLASTRPAPNTVGPRTAGIGPDGSYTLDGWGTEGDCTLPSDTAGLALNVTAVNATQQTNLRFFPADAAVPGTANLNPSPGAPPTPNAVNVNLDSSGQFTVFNKFGTVEVVIDVMGYYVDHNHDDRYYQKSEVYTQAEVDAALAARQPRVLLPDPAIDVFYDFDFVAEANLSSAIEQTITTDVAGQLELDVYASAFYSCSAGSDSIIFITVDGTAVESSAFLLRTTDGSRFSMVLSGITETPIAAGDHTIGVGYECRATATAQNPATDTYSISSAVLHPSN